MFVYSLLAVRGLGSCMGFSPVAASRGTLLAVPGFSLQGRLWLHSSGSRVPSFSSCGSWVSGSQALSRGSVVLVDGACGIFPGQGPNPGLLHWQADSSPLSCQGSPEITVKGKNVQPFCLRFRLSQASLLLYFYSAGSWMNQPL